jgi:hypothetical protein
MTQFVFRSFALAYFFASHPKLFTRRRLKCQQTVLVHCVAVVATVLLPLLGWTQPFDLTHAEAEQQRQQERLDA